MLTIKDLHVAVEGKTVLKGINLKVPDNEVHALFGPNGSGKSVLIYTMLGFPGYEIIRGDICYNNNNIKLLSIDERVRLGIGILEQRPPTIKGVKLKRLIEMIKKVRETDKCYIDRQTEKYDMVRFLERNINEGFSGGEIKKAELFLLMITRPSFLILDEPDSGVDPEHLKTIGHMINEALYTSETPGVEFEPKPGKSGIIATHSASILDYIYVDKAHIMLNGKIRCTGNPGIMMEQIRRNGYEYCIECQKKREGDIQNGIFG